MKTILATLLILICAVQSWSKSTSIPGKCEDAMSKARVIAAKHNWAAARPDAQSPVIEIETRMSTGKAIGVSAATMGIGAMFMHPKSGQLLFEQQAGACKVSSKGDPADKLLNELKKAPPGPAAADTGQKGAEAAPAPDVKAETTKSVELGQTPEQVEATLGKPEKVVNLGSKKIYVYKDLKIVFVDDKVADVQ